MRRAVGLVVLLLAGWASAQTESVIYSFPNTGKQFAPQFAYPNTTGGLIISTTEGTNDHLTDGEGTVYSLTTDGTTLVKLWSVSASGGDTTFGSPQGTLGIDASGNIFGASAGAGSCGGIGSACGAIWELVQSSGYSMTPLYTFSSSDTAGHAPSGGVTIGADGNLYGTSFTGGSNADGTLWEFDLTHNSLTVLHTFAGGSTDCAAPFGPLYRNGNILYGVTSSGGSANAGCVFTLDTSTETYNAVAFLSGTDGSDPLGQPFLFDTRLWITASQGGANNLGSVIAFNVSTWAEAYVYPFQGVFSTPKDGASPRGGFFTAFGDIYLTTWSGGANNFGTITEFNPTGTSYIESVPYSFPGGSTNGANPDPGTVIIGGNLYGAAHGGGASSCDGIACGVVWKVTP